MENAQCPCVIGMITAVVGIQFGDEGKGKIVDFLSSRFDYVVRFNGGRNAGHTVVVEDKKFKFHVVPSGALRTRNAVLGNGMVIDLRSLLDEIDMVKAINPEVSVFVSNRAHVVTPLHKLLDRKEEEARGPSKIGTTFEGIGPTYEDKYARTGIRVEDLDSKEKLTEKLLLITRMKKSLLGDDCPDSSEIDNMVSELHSMGKKLEGFIASTEMLVNKSWKDGKNIIFEGANGTLLDIDFGIFPFVTSSNTIAGFISAGAGFSFRKVNTVIGVVKAYVSKVGAGPFPSELHGETADMLREFGHEYGTTTGRPRRVGWLDIPALKYTIQMSDVDVLAVTNLDTLGNMEEIFVGTKYSYPDSDEEVFHPDTRHLNELAKLKIEYTKMSSWGPMDDDAKKEIIHNGPKALPKELRDYIRFIEEKTERPVGIISFGSGRKNTLIMDGLDLPKEIK